ncbi:hypothetical protein [Pseudoalteromonas sp. B160]|uniref:hypothetical protein n=1 Tax=Pseudoalteromonas sp. B160 TaxID=630414 RepID=UPI00301D322B
MFVLSDTLNNINQEIETKYRIGDTLPGQEVFAMDTLYSLPMVREALFILDIIGVIKVSPGKRTRVINKIENISKQDIERGLNKFLSSNVNYSEISSHLNEIYDVGETIISERIFSNVLNVRRNELRKYFIFLDFLGYFEIKKGDSRTILKKLPTNI